MLKPSEMNLLMAYAAGQLDPLMETFVASKLCFCDASCEAVEKFEQVGGILLEDTEPEALKSLSCDELFERLEEKTANNSDTNDQPQAVPPSDADKRFIYVEDIEASLPRPLAHYMNAQRVAPMWKKDGFGIKHLSLPVPNHSDGQSHNSAMLVHLAPGAKALAHRHRGTEYTLVLEGGFRDSGQEYHPGHSLIMDADTDHQPIAFEDEGCLCLMVLDAPVRFKGFVGTIANLFWR